MHLLNKPQHVELKQDPNGGGDRNEEDVLIEEMKRCLKSNTTL